MKCYLIVLIFIVACILSTNAEESEYRKLQRDVLIEFYNQTEYGRQFIEYALHEEVDVCNWIYHQCDLNMHIYRIGPVNSYFYNGSLPDSFGQLRSLQHLDLSSGKFSTFPEVVTQLTNLKTLKVSNSYMKGTIPDSLSNLINLEDLNLEVNELTGTIPSALKDLPNLKRLNLLWNQLTGTIPAALMRKPYAHFFVHYNNLTGAIPPSIFESGAKWMDFSDNHFTHFAENIPRPPMMMSCNFANNNFECPIPRWAKQECSATCTIVTDRNNASAWTRVDIGSLFIVLLLGSAFF